MENEMQIKEEKRCIICNRPYNHQYDLFGINCLTNSVPMSLLSSTLNNFAAISSAYNVIKPFNFKLKIKNDDYIIENIKQE